MASTLSPAPRPGTRLTVPVSRTVVLLARVRPVRHASALWVVELATVPACYPFWCALVSPVRAAHERVTVTVGARNRWAARSLALTLARAAASVLATSGPSLRRAVAHALS